MKEQIRCRAVFPAGSAKFTVRPSSLSRLDSVLHCILYPETLLCSTASEGYRPMESLALGRYARKTARAEDGERFWPGSNQRVC